MQRKILLVKMAGAVSRYLKDLCIKDIWEAAVGKTLVCALGPNNSRDRNTGTIVAAGIRAVNGPHGSGRSLSAV